MREAESVIDVIGVVVNEKFFSWPLEPIWVTLPPPKGAIENRSPA